MNHFMLNHVVTISEAMANFKYASKVCLPKLQLATCNMQYAHVIFVEYIDHDQEER
jgi:hypothetical protein